MRPSKRLEITIILDLQTLHCNISHCHGGKKVTGSKVNNMLIVAFHVNSLKNHFMKLTTTKGTSMYPRVLDSCTLRQHLSSTHTPWYSYTCTMVRGWMWEDERCPLSVQLWVVVKMDCISIVVTNLLDMA